MNAIKHHSYKHGLCKNLSLSGRDLNREKVRIRDNHTCQKCGGKWTLGTRRFDVHHLEGCGLKSRLYDKEEDMINLITMHHKCHLNLEAVLKKMQEHSSPRPNKPVLS